MSSNSITVIGLLAAACTTASYLPQVLKTLRSRRTADISLLTYLILTAGLLLWFAYGVLLRDLPMMLANGITSVLAVTVLALKIRYG